VKKGKKKKKNKPSRRWLEKKKPILSGQVIRHRLVVSENRQRAQGGERRPLASRSKEKKMEGIDNLPPSAKTPEGGAHQ